MAGLLYRVLCYGGRDGWSSYGSLQSCCSQHSRLKCWAQHLCTQYAVAALNCSVVGSASAHGLPSWGMGHSGSVLGMLIHNLGVRFYHLDSILLPPPQSPVGLACDSSQPGGIFALQGTFGNVWRCFFTRDGRVVREWPKISIVPRF